MFGYYLFVSTYMHCLLFVVYYCFLQCLFVNFLLVYYFCLIHVFYCLLFSFSLVYSAEPCIVSANSTDTTACEENADDQFGNLGYALVKVIRVFGTFFSIHNYLHLGLGIVNGERSFFFKGTDGISG